MEITKKFVEESMKSIQTAMITNHNQGQKLSGKLDACAYMLKQLEAKEPKAGPEKEKQTTEEKKDFVVKEK